VSSWNGTLSNPAAPVLQCGCCSTHKPERNGDARCDLCVAAGCKKAYAGYTYRAADGCPRRAKVVRQARNYVRGGK
jgi:hypothetical protein